MVNEKQNDIVEWKGAIERDSKFEAVQARSYAWYAPCCVLLHSSRITNGYGNNNPRQNLDIVYSMLIE